MLASLMAVVMLGLDSEQAPTTLVERLGSPVAAERRHAANALRDLGEGASAALGAARDADDPAIRARAAAVLAAIEQEVLLRPTTMTLDFEDKSLAEVAKAIGDRNRVRLELPPGGPAGRRISLKEPRPVTYWTALDRLREVGGLRHDHTMHWEPIRGGFYFLPLDEWPTLSLSDEEGRQGSPRCDDGPFRMLLEKFSHVNVVPLLRADPDKGPTTPGTPGPIVARPPGGRDGADERFTFEMVTMAEPRLLIEGLRPRLLEAVDDRGQSLRPTTTPIPGAVGPNFDFYNDAGPHCARSREFLKYPSEPGERIKVLRGTMSLAIAARAAVPLVIPLADAEGESYRTGHSTITIHKMAPDPPANLVTLELGIRRHDRNALLVASPGLDKQAQAINFPHNYLELLDDRGRPLLYYVNRSDSGPDDPRVRLHVMGGEAGEKAIAPTALRFHDLIRASTEVPFEFRDLPMP